MKYMLGLVLIFTGCATVKDIGNTFADIGRRAVHYTSPEEARANEAKQAEHDRLQRLAYEQQAQEDFKREYPYFNFLVKKRDEACSSDDEEKCDESQGKLLQEGQRIQSEMRAASEARRNAIMSAPIPVYQPVEIYQPATAWPQLPQTGTVTNTNCYRYGNSINCNSVTGH